MYANVVAAVIVCPAKRPLKQAIGSMRKMAWRAVKKKIN